MWHQQKEIKQYNTASVIYMYNKCMRQVNSTVHADQVPSSSAHLLHKTSFHKTRIHHQTTASYTGNESMKISIFNRACGLSAVKFSSFATQDASSQNPHSPLNYFAL